MGAAIQVDLPELNTRGAAKVLSIEPSPVIQPGSGSIVAGRFRHVADQLLDVYVEGMNHPIGCTARHPFWSATRREFVEARQLRVGERLLANSGELTAVVSVNSRSNSETVYNLEILGPHEYRVSRLGVLAHNSSWRQTSLANTANGIRGIGIADYLDPITNRYAIGDLSGLDGDYILPKSEVKQAIDKFRRSGARLTSDQSKLLAMIMNGTDNLHLLPSSFNRSKGNLTIADWVGVGLGKLVNIQYARRIAVRQSFIASQIDDILGGRFVDPSFSGQVISQ